MTRRAPTEESAGRLVTFLLDKGLGGFPPLSSAEDLATEYLIDQGYATHDARVDSLVKWETGKNFTTGFITGLGGFMTLPVGVPSALGASWLIQARMAGAIARIYGHDLGEDRVRTMILLSLAGDVAREAMEGFGVNFSGRLSNRVVKQVPGPGARRGQQADRAQAARQGRWTRRGAVPEGDSGRRRGRGRCVRCGGLPDGGAHREVAFSAGDGRLATGQGTWRESAAECSHRPTRVRLACWLTAVCDNPRLNQRLHSILSETFHS